MNLLSGIAYRELAVTENSAYTGSTISFRNGIEEPRFAYGANIMCAVDLSQRFSVEGGIGYALMGYQLNMDALTFGDAIDPNRGFIYQTNDAPIAVRYNMEFLELPLRLVMRCGKGRLASITGLGLTTGYLFRTGRSLWFPDGSTDRWDTTSEDGYRTTNLFPTLSTGAAYTLSEHLELRLEASGRYGLIGIVDAPITAHLWCAGLGCGVMWTP
jgi:hypothetical protein